MMHRQFTGFMLIILGALVLLQSLGIFHLGLAFWPVVLVWIGLEIAWGSLLDRPEGPSVFGALVGLLVAGAGVDKMLENAGLVTALSWGDLARIGGPVLLIGIGLSVLFGRHRSRWERRGHWDKVRTGSTI